MLRPKLNRVWASQSANSRRDPGDAKYLIGWVSEIPTFQVLNYLQYKVDTTILAQAERGIFEWGNDVQYKLGSIVWNEIDGYVYVSVVGSPDKNKSPNTNPTQWSTSSIQVTRAQYDSIASQITTHIADVTSNPHKVTANDVNTYNKAQIDALVAQYNALVKTHVDDNNNPHQVTAAQVGAVPITGGEYTGDVTFLAGLFLTSDKTKSITKDGGLFLKSGTNLIGVSDAGVASAGTAGNLSPLVTEASFASLKLSREPDYATQYPAVGMDFIRNICIRTGAGTINSNNLPIQYEGSTGALSIKNEVDTARTMTGDTNFIGGMYNVTIACDIKSTSPRITGDGGTSLYVGLLDVRLYSTGSGIVGFEVVDRSANPIVYSGTTFQLTGEINTWYRIVGVWDGLNKFKIYCNGVLMAQASTGAPIPVLAAAGSALHVAISPRTAVQQRTFQLRNLRVWSKSMSDQAVSTL